MPTTQISIRNLDAATAARLKRNAKRRGQSLNRYLQTVLRQSAASEEIGARVSHDDLDALAGCWTAAQAAAFEDATAPFSKVDKAIWR
jgi:plasmid stability protein